MNFSIKSINLNKYYYNSPFISLNDYKISISSSFFNLFFNSVIFSKRISFLISVDNKFNNFLNSPIYIQSFQELTSIYETNNSIYIFDSIFQNCSSNSGGAIYILGENLSLYASRITFYKCSALTNTGGALWIEIKNSTIIQCCFSNCFSIGYRNAGGGWIKDFGYLNSSIIIKCSPNNLTGGGGSFGYWKGTQIINNINSTFNYALTYSQFFLRYSNIYSILKYSLFKQSFKQGSLSLDDIGDYSYCNIINNSENGLYFYTNIYNNASTIYIKDFIFQNNLIDCQIDNSNISIYLISCISNNNNFGFINFSLNCINNLINNNFKLNILKEYNCYYFNNYFLINFLKKKFNFIFLPLINI